MEIRFSSEVEQIVQQAQELAAADKHSTTLPEYLLLAMLNLPENDLSQKMMAKGLDPENLHAEMPRGIMPGNKILTPPLNTQARLVVEQAAIIDNPLTVSSLLIALTEHAQTEDPPNLKRILHHCRFPVYRLFDIANSATDERRKNPRRRRWEIDLLPEARSILQTAEEESRAMDHNYIFSEHLLLAMLNNNKLQAQRILTTAGLDYERSKEMVLSFYSVNPNHDNANVLAISDQARTILEKAADRAFAAGQQSWNDISLLTSFLESDLNSQKILSTQGVDAHAIYLAMDRTRSNNKETNQTLEDKVGQLDNRVEVLERRLGIITD